MFIVVLDSDILNAPRPLKFIQNMSLFVHAVKCGRTHTLILTNNGVSKKCVSNIN